MKSPLNQAKYKQKALISERAKNRTNIAGYERAGAALAERNAALTAEILALSATIGAEERKEREARHKVMADELTAAGYKVAMPIKEGQLILFGMPIARGRTTWPSSEIYKDILAVYGDLQMYDKNTGKPAGTLATALSGGGKAPGMNTPGSGAGSAHPVAKAPKPGGVHGVGEGWYRPIVYGSNGVKLEHDFAINTRDHHEARNGWWLKHVPSGQITKGFPNEAEVYRWIKGRSRPGAYKVQFAKRSYQAGVYPDVT